MYKFDVNRPVLKAGCAGHHKAEIDVAIIIWLWLQQIANIKFSRFLENIRLDLAGSWGAARGQLFVIINFKPAEIIMMLVC